MKARRRGFTLIELLVVVGIIGVLVAILLPALSRAQDQAKSVQCESNLRQIGIALNAYASSNEELLPAWSGWHVYPSLTPNPENTDPTLLSWTEQLMPYLGAAPVSPLFNCPAFPEEFRINYFLEARWEEVQPVEQHTMKVSQIRNSSEFVISGDCTGPSLYPPTFGVADETSDDCDKDDASQPGLLFLGESNGINMHPGGNNVLFWDGHVEQMKLNPYDIQGSFLSTTMTFSPHREHISWENVVPD